MTPVDPFELFRQISVLGVHEILLTPARAEELYKLLTADPASCWLKILDGPESLHKTMIYGVKILLYRGEYPVWPKWRDNWREARRREAGL